MFNLGTPFTIFVAFSICWVLGYFIWALKSKE